MVATVFSPDGPAARAVTFNVSPIFTVPAETATLVFPAAACKCRPLPINNRPMQSITHRIPRFFFLI